MYSCLIIKLNTFWLQHFQGCPLNLTIYGDFHHAQMFPEDYSEFFKAPEIYGNICRLFPSKENGFPGLSTVLEKPALKH